MSMYIVSNQVSVFLDFTAPLWVASQRNLLICRWPQGASVAPPAPVPGCGQRICCKHIGLCASLIWYHPFFFSVAFNVLINIAAYHLPLCQCIANAFPILILSVRFIVPLVVQRYLVHWLPPLSIAQPMMRLQHGVMFHITLTLWRPIGFGDFRKKSRLNAHGFAREFLWSGMLYRPGKSLKRRGKSSSLHLKKIFCLGCAGFLWVTS